MPALQHSLEELSRTRHHRIQEVSTTVVVAHLEVCVVDMLENQGRRPRLQDGGISSRDRKKRREV